MLRTISTPTFLAALSLTLFACNDPDGKETGDPDNTAPTAEDDIYELDEDEAGEKVSLNVRENDSDPDVDDEGNGDDLGITEVTQPANGTAEIAGPDQYIFYTSNTDFTGEDTFEYTISDGRGGTDTATVIVSVAAPPPLPCQEEGDCTLVINGPEDGTTVEGEAVTVSFTVTGCEMSSPSNNPAGCHLHKVIDGPGEGEATFYKNEGGSGGSGHYDSGTFDLTSSESPWEAPVLEGEHVLQLILIKNDGTDDPFEVLVDDTVTFTVGTVGSEG